MDHVRPAQLIVAPRTWAGRQRGHGPGAALEVEFHLEAARSAGHVRAGRLEVALRKPDVRPSRSPAHPSGTVTGGAHFHYYRQSWHGR